MKTIISVVICCYNSSARLPETLKHLALQVVPDDFYWEVIVVDNNSTDNTADVAKALWKEYGEKGPFRVVFEPQPGLSYARRRGVEESKGEFIIFCDDDNWLCSSYIIDVYNILNKDSSIGVVGGWGEAVYTHQPEDWFVEGNFFKRMATGSQGETSGDITLAKGYVYGAGMAASRKLLLDIFNNEIHYLNDRTGSLLLGGGDLEICYLIRIAGYKIWYSDKLKFKHYMPASRMTSEYLAQLSKGKAYSSVLLLPYELVFARHPYINKNFIWLRVLKRRIKSYIQIIISGNPKTELSIVRQRMSKNSLEGSISSLLVNNFKIDARVKTLKNRILDK